MISFRRTSKTFYYMWLVLLSTQLLKHLVAEQDDRGALIQHKACNLGHRDLMLVSLMNGEVTALNLFDGTVLWQISTGQKLFCSSLSTLEVLYNGIPTRLVPSLDGSLFRFHNEHFEPLPFSAETLLSSSFKLPGDSTMVGSKELRTVGLDPACGQLFYRCDKDGCDRREQNLQEKDVLVIKHMTHTVRAVSARDGAEKWNFSVGHHELGFSEKMDSVYTSDGKEQCDSSFCQTNLPTLKFFYI
ncbi:hypothetical protein EB796_008753 [Bugula neritina]|uniref:Bulb-type lectin domain-containing protein n=1 Tax=Bugula neritina TaxID=10212 RepID=A0A7J7K412_BUGNE|nr:hypothetical protein EB796_008753 [Bugula neritina]